ncbi:MAG: carboxypeptidase regulatory-like domain-containing protein, partial [Bacteroidota bacterium]
MKLTVLTLLGCLLGSSALLAQTHTVKGVIHNEAEEVVPFAALSLFNSSDSTLSKTGVADGNGNFRLVGVPSGNYYLMASSVGHQPYSSAVFAVNKDVTLPRISMAKSAQNLEEVTITGTKPVVEVQADRTVFNVQQTLSASGSTGLELLRKAPGVIVDNNDNVILDGKSGVQVYLDGKPLRLAGQDLTDYLKGMSSDEIESIELITQPSARYEAAGSAGIINIVLKKDLRYGLRGSAEGGYGIGRFAKYNGRVSLSQRTKKFSMFGSYGLRVAKDRNFFDFVREQGNTVFDQASATVNDGNYHQARAGVDYFASSKSTFGIVVNSTINDGVASTGSRTDIGAAGSDAVDQVLVAANEDDRTNYSVFTNLNYRFKDTLGNELSVDLDHGYYNSDRTLLQPNTYLSGDRSEVLLERNFRMITPVEIQILSAKADYEFTLGNVKVTTGAKVTDVSSENDFQ